MHGSIYNSTLSPEKITKIIQNWNVRFDGSPNGLRCEEFIYRIRCLTNETLNGNFDLVCRNLNVLLTNKARNWFWRFHKQVDRISWDNFCSALRHQYRDYRTSFDLHEDLRNRKQKPSQSFYDSVTEIVDQLPNNIDESELVEIMTRNLRPEIRHELLYVKINSIAHLRKLCQMRENLFKDDLFKRNQFAKMNANVHNNRRIAKIDSPAVRKF